MDKVRPLVSFLCLWAFCCSSQNDTLYFKHYTVDNGLSHRNVSSIIQDSLGFMWYGTQEGLNKFDGYKFIPFKHDPQNPNSLAHDDISCLAVEKSGIIWIGTKMKGLNRYDPYKGVFELFEKKDNTNSISNNCITSLSVDTFHRVIWVGTREGLNAFDPVTKKVKVYKSIPGKNSLSENSITCIKVDKKGRVWIGTDGGGLNYFDVKTGRFTAYRNDQKDTRSLSSDQVRDVFIDKGFNVWAATANGLSCLPFDSSHFIIHKHNDKDEHSVSSNDLTSVYQDKYGKIWVGTARQGLCVYYPKQNKFYLYSYDKDSPNSLNTNRINSISQGRSGMFWAATIDGGLNAFNPKSLKFNLWNPIGEQKDAYTDLVFAVPHNEDEILLGTRTQGVYLLGKSTRHYSISEVRAAVPYKKGSYFLAVGSVGGIFETASGQFSGLTDKTNKNEITALAYSAPDILWIGRSNGELSSFDLRSSQIRSYSLNAAVVCLAGGGDNIFAGTDGEGLVKIDKNGNLTAYKNLDGVRGSIGGNFISSLVFDSKGVLWIGTRYGGLNSLSPGSSRFDCFTVHEGLPGNSISSLQTDNNLNLWAGTDHGICRLTLEDKKLKQCRLFDLVDGLPTTEFYGAVSCVLNNGRMMYSCRKGLISFSPDSLKNNPYKPPVIISDLFLFNKLIQPGDSTGILKSSISVAKDLFLNYDQNSVSFEFTAISFINAGKNKYAYKLEGFDKDWNYRNAQNRTASYTNLDPGEYTLHIKASNNDGVWNDRGTSLRIFIASPFWQKWWFFALCAAAVSGIFYLVYFVRLRHVMRMQQVRNKISQDLHDNIGSTLSSISIYSEVAKKMVAERVPESVTVLEGLGDSATVAMDTMSDIVWAINPSNDSFASILQRVRIFSTQLFEARNIEAHYDVCADVDDIKLPMQYVKDVYLIMKEALNNVAKYSRATQCFIRVERKDRQITIEIMDNGVGMKEKKDSLGGNGIMNMKQRAAELGGSLLVLSKENEGTTVSFWFTY